MTPSTAANFCVCARCTVSFAAGYGFANDRFCSPDCEAPPIDMPDDDDGYDGLPFDPCDGPHHCVLISFGCDPDALPESWRREAHRALAELSVRHYGATRCVCEHSHTVLSREDVRALRLAGYTVEARSEVDCIDDAYNDYDDGYFGRDYSDWDDVLDRYSAAAYLRGAFDDCDHEDRDYSIECDVRECGMDDVADELDVIAEMGFVLPTGDREVGDVAPPAPVSRIGRTDGGDVTIGVFAVRFADGEYVVTHRFGGLVPTKYRRDGYVANVRMFSREDAVHHATQANDALRNGTGHPWR